MGEARKDALRLDFDRRLRLEFHGTKIEWHAGELFPRVNFVVTNLRCKSSNVVKFYNKRGPDDWQRSEDLDR
jgi:hypothetical protein